MPIKEDLPDSRDGGDLRESLGVGDLRDSFEGDLEKDLSEVFSSISSESPCPRFSVCDVSPPP